MSIEDRAQERELQEWEARNLGRSNKPASYQPEDEGYGPAECEECEAEMHPVRRGYGFRICVHCKEMSESVARMRVAG
jgi:hypothetical protein